MEKVAYTLETLLQEKIELYRDLKKKLEQERYCIANIDVDSLWKITDRKNQISSKIGQIRVRILNLPQVSNISFDMDIRSFNLSRIIDRLSVSLKRKSDLNKLNIELNALKENLSILASENKRYTNEYLAVINGIFATITDIENREQYTKHGQISKNKPANHLLRAEV